MINPHHRGRGWGFGLTLFLLSGTAFSNDSAEFFGRFETSLVSEPEVLRSTLRDWGSDFNKGERQWAVAMMELGTRIRGFEFSLQRRAQLDLRINEEAAEFYGRIERKEQLEPGTSVPLELRVDTFSADAFRVGYRFQGTMWQLTVGAAYLGAEQLISGGLHGELSAINESDFDLAATVDYVYYKDAIFKRNLDSEPKGEGWAVDLSGQLQLNNHWQLYGRADDLFGRIRWKDVPYTVARAHTDRKVYDEDGFAVFKPLATGREGYHSRFTQDLRPRYQAEIRYTAGDWQASMHGRHQFGYSLTGVGTGYQLNEGMNIQLTWWPELNAASLQWSGEKWQAQLMLDSLSTNRGKSTILSISYGF